MKTTETEHDPHAHPAYLAHHFETPRQQFEAGKLGMWIFLLTEVLLFSGMFCAYAVYRATHPAIFEFGHRFLDTNLGAINTAILISSSFTMAWAVRCAQLNHRIGTVLCLSLTLLGGCGFLSIKYVEYKHKWQEGLLWASRFHPIVAASEGDHSAKSPGVSAAEGTSPTAAPASVAASSAGSASSAAAPALPSVSPSPAPPETGVVPSSAAASQTSLAPGQEPLSPDDDKRPLYAGIFFSIYFAMTGLHGVHVIAGMGAIAWVLVRAARGAFNSSYFGPVDYVGLYWHLVDLVWIYLFPLLYLIH